MPCFSAPAGAPFSRPLHAALVAGGLVTGPVQAATVGNPLPVPLPSGQSVELKSWLTIPASSNSSPKARINHLKPCPGDARLFCNDLRGKLWVIPSKSAASASAFLDLAVHFPKFIASPGLGTGFASFAFHPEFHQPGAPGHGKFYTAHSESVNGAAPDFTGPLSPDLSQLGIITEWTLANPAASAVTTAPANFTRREILRAGFPYNFHDLQEIAFDPTATPGHENYGCLFLCLGDGGSVVLDNPGNIGRIDSPFGTILRVAPVLATAHQPAHFTLSANGNYYIPSGPGNANPWVAAADPVPGDGFPVVREIYAHGFRNPHRITWDAGKMFCGNIGESMIEEVELVTKGSHHGWPEREGSFFFTHLDKTHVYPLPAPETGGYAYPVSQYDHGEGRCAIAGGHVYRGTAVPALQGHYLFGDIVTGDLFITPAAAMSRAATTDTGHTPAPPQTLAVKSAGTPTTYRTLLGASRADLRIGHDHEGELYLLSKHNGKIHRILPDTAITTPPPAGTVEDWQPLADFEDGILPALSPTHAGSSVQIVNDPAEGPVNRVLRLAAPGSASLGAHLPIPPIAEGSRGTVHFRFYLVDQHHDASFGVSERATPTLASHYRAQLRSAADSGFLQAKEATAFTTATDIRLRTWYTAWLHLDNATGTAADRYDLYLQGGQFGVPTLVKSGLAFANAGVTTAIRTFYWRILPGTEIYFDDLHSDSGHVNFTAPRSADWQLVDRFDGPDPLAAWDLPAAAAQSLTIAAEPSGNRYLRRAASSSTAANPAAIAAKRLPFPTPVSRTLTLFFRLRLEGGNFRHSFGASATDPFDPASYTEADFAPQLLLPPGGNLHLYDGPAGSQSFLPAPVPALQADVWYKVWIVAYNGGAASGGQTWHAWLQGGEHAAPVQLGPPVHFRRQAEMPLTHFLTLAASGSGIGNDAVHLDDLHAYEGLNLADPLAPVWQPTTLTRAGDEITLGHPTAFNRAFQLYESADLHTWQPLGPAAEGDAGWRQMTVAIAHPRRFFQAAELSRRDYHAAGWATLFPDPEPPRGLTLLSSSAWAYTPGLLTLQTPGPQLADMPARPGGYALIPGDWRNATLTVDARPLGTSATRDLVLIFGYVDETHFYYARIGMGGTNGIFKVDGPTSAPIHAPATPPVTLTGAWQTLRVTHAATGAIAVHAGDLATPFMTAVDTRFPAGRCGFGSHDDHAEFRAATLTGESP